MTDTENIHITEDSADMNVDAGEPEATDQRCPECGGNMTKEMDRHQNFIYTCTGCGYTESN